MASLTDYGFPFNSVSSDRTYNASVWRDYFSNLFTDGVIPDKLNELIVTESDTPAKSVKVDTGYVLIEGTQYGLTTSTDLTIADNASGSTRIDRIVARLDYANRNCEIEVLQGTTVAPTLTQNASVWEISLAQIEVTNGFTTITNANITDERAFVKIGSIENYQIASQAEAEAGTSNVKYMTPLTTKQAIDYNFGFGFTNISASSGTSQGLFSATDQVSNGNITINNTDDRFECDKDGYVEIIFSARGADSFEEVYTMAIFKNGTEIQSQRANGFDRETIAVTAVIITEVVSGDYIEFKSINNVGIIDGQATIKYVV